jgi:putative membrane protein
MVIGDNSMARLVLKWALNSLALFLVMKLIPGMQIDRFQDLLLATLVIGLLNAFLRPVIILLTLPVTILTLGLFTLVINGFMFYLASHLVTGFHITGFGAAFVSALLFSLFSFALNLFFGTKKISYSER